MTVGVSTVIDKVCVGIESGRQADSIGTPGIAKSVHVEVGSTATDTGSKQSALCIGKVRKVF